MPQTFRLTAADDPDFDQIATLIEDGSPISFDFILRSAFSPTDVAPFEGPGGGSGLNLTTAGIEIASIELRISPFKINALYDAIGNYTGYEIVGKNSGVITFEVSALRRARGPKH